MNKKCQFTVQKKVENFGIPDKFFALYNLDESSNG